MRFQLFVAYSELADLAVQLGAICSPAVIFVLSFGSLLFLCYTAPCVKKCPEETNMVVVWSVLILLIFILAASYCRPSMTKD